MLAANGTLFWFSFFFTCVSVRVCLYRYVYVYIIAHIIYRLLERTHFKTINYAVATDTIAVSLYTLSSPVNLKLLHTPDLLIDY